MTTTPAAAVLAALAIFFAHAAAATPDATKDCGDDNPRHTWLIVPSILETTFGQTDIATGWQHGGERYRRDMVLTGIHLVPTPSPRHWLLRQHGGPDIHLRFEEGAFADPTVDACMANTLETAVAGIPAVVTRSLPTNTHIVAEKVNDVGTWTATRLEHGEYRVSVHPDHLNYGCIGRGGVECCRPGQAYAYTGYVSHFEEILIHEFAHVIDLHFSITHGELHGDWWKAVQTTGRTHPTHSFVSVHAAKNVYENFAETMTAWLAYRSGRMEYSIDDPDNTAYRDHMNAKMCREMEWWDDQMMKAAASPNGTLQPNAVDWHSPSWTPEEASSRVLSDSF